MAFDHTQMVGCAGPRTLCDDTYVAMNVNILIVYSIQRLDSFSHGRETFPIFYVESMTFNHLLIYSFNQILTLSCPASEAQLRVVTSSVTKNLNTSMFLLTMHLRMDPGQEKNCSHVSVLTKSNAANLFGPQCSLQYAASCDPSWNLLNCQHTLKAGGGSSVMTHHDLKVGAQFETHRIEELQTIFKELFQSTFPFSKNSS